MQPFKPSGRPLTGARNYYGRQAVEAARELAKWIARRSWVI
jgi:hypothetical protein